MDSNAKGIKALAVVSALVSFSSLLIIISGSELYSSSDHHQSLVCNYGYAGIPFLLMGLVGIIPCFVRNNSVMVLVTAALSVLTVILFISFTSLAMTPSYYEFDNAKSGYYMYADLSIGRAEEGMCYDGTNFKSVHCSCIHEVESPPRDVGYLTFCSSDCNTAHDGIWAMWSFTFIAFLLSFTASVIGCMNGGCACCENPQQVVREVIPMASPVTTASATPTKV